MHRTILTCITGMLTLGLCGCPQARLATSPSYVLLTQVYGEHDIPPEVNSLHATVLNGSIEIIAGPDNKVSVQAEVKIKKDRLKPDQPKGEFADHVRLEIKDGNLTVTDAHLNQPDQSDWQLSVVIHAPARLAVTASTTAGSLTTDGMTADLDLKTEAGRITIKGDRIASATAKVTAGAIDLQAATATGPIKASVVTGQVTVHITDTAPTKDVRLETATGNVMLELPKDAPGTFAAQSRIGSVEFPGRQAVTVKRVGLGAEAAGTIGKEGPNYDLTADVGNVTVR